MSDQSDEYSKAVSKAEAHFRQIRKIYEEVGRGISAWAVMETAIIQIASRLLQTAEHKAGLVLYSINNFYTWINIIDGLFAEDGEFPKSQKAWSGVISDLKKYNDTRVRLAHQMAYTELWRGLTGDINLKSLGLKPTHLDVRPKHKTQPPLTETEIVAFDKDVTAMFERLHVILEQMDGPKALR